MPPRTLLLLSYLEKYGQLGSQKFEKLSFACLRKSVGQVWKQNVLAVAVGRFTIGESG
jgi:hypothetical protein